MARLVLTPPAMSSAPTSGFLSSESRSSNTSSISFIASERPAMAMKVPSVLAPAQGCALLQDVRLWGTELRCAIEGAFRLDLPTESRKRPRAPELCGRIGRLSREDR